MYTDVILPIDDPAKAQELLDTVPVGVSPGYAAASLDMTRQALNLAIRKGSLPATRIFATLPDGKTRHEATYIEIEAIEEYKAARSGRQRVPKGFQANQHRLFA